MNTCDIVLIGVGGQGVVTLGDLITRAALAAEVPVAYVPTKGMAQRGGFVKVEIRLGHTQAGPRVPESGADIVVAMERSESLKGVQFVRPDGCFILYDHVWKPTGVMLGEDEYPSQEAVLDALTNACSNVLVLNPEDRPTFDGRPVAANIFTLGAMLNVPILRELVDPGVMQEALLQRWPKSADANGCAFRAGLDAAGNSHEGELLGSSPCAELLFGEETNVLV